MQVSLLVVKNMTRFNIFMTPKTIPMATGGGDQSVETAFITSEPSFKRAAPHRHHISSIRVAISCGLCAAVFVVVTVSLAISEFAVTSSEPDTQYRVLVLGGRGPDTLPVARPELVSVGRCPATPAPASANLSFPALPAALRNMTASYLAGPAAVRVCGVKEDSRARCWVVRNGTSWWEAEQEREGKEEEEQEVTLAEAGEEAGCSHRHEAAVTRLGNTWLMLGGRR